MQSTIAICNVALTSYLGTRSITSFNDGSPEAEQCELHYDRVRQSLLVWFECLLGKVCLVVVIYGL